MLASSFGGFSQTLIGHFAFSTSAWQNCLPYDQNSKGRKRKG
jgi:hypothetical protein